MNKFQPAELTNFQIFKIIFFPVIILFAIIIPSTVKAATFYLDPASSIIGLNQTIELKVKIGVAGGECVNVAQVGITFPSDILEFKDFNSGESFLSLWLQQPGEDSLAKINRDGKIIFSGGLPGGYCGVINGDPGESNIVGSLIFTPKKPVLFHKAKIDFSSETQAFLNDGNGTEAPINVQGAVLQIDESITSTTNAWAEQVAADKTPPEPFTIEIDNSPRIAGGKYFVVFSTVDKQTGVDHYEILETKAGDLQEKKINVLAEFIRKIFQIKEPLPPVWVKSVSPYILKDQSLNSVIKVKAVDRAGNERIVEFDNAIRQSLASSRPINWPPIIFGAGGLLVIIFALTPIIVFLRRKMKPKIKLE